jgi:hypothetical protein
VASIAEAALQYAPQGARDEVADHDRVAEMQDACNGAGRFGFDALELRVETRQRTLRRIGERNRRLILAWQGRIHIGGGDGSSLLDGFARSRGTAIYGLAFERNLTDACGGRWHDGRLGGGRGALAK